jgi:hypothetical protein
VPILNPPPADLKWSDLADQLKLVRACGAAVLPGVKWRQINLDKISKEKRDHWWLSLTRC